jgi:hypothetical protein
MIFLIIIIGVSGAVLAWIIAGAMERERKL